MPLETRVSGLHIMAANSMGLSSFKPDGSGRRRHSHQKALATPARNQNWV